MDVNKAALGILLVLFSILSEGSALECYVCSNQTDNTEKCLNTIKTCEPGEDTCLSEVRWGSTPYFSLGAQKQYYVSKRCSTKRQCQKLRSKFMPFCDYIWYNDYFCVHCCSGDRCNYYVISGAPTKKSTTIVLFSLFWSLGYLLFTKY